MSTTQPNALRLADLLDRIPSFAYTPTDAAAAAELRRQHIEIARLQAALDDAQAAESVAQMAADALRADAERYLWLRSRLPGSAYRIAGVLYSEGGAGVDGDEISDVEIGGRIE